MTAVWTDIRRVIGWQPGPHGMTWLDLDGQETTREATEHDLVAWLAQQPLEILTAAVRAAAEAGGAR